MRFRSIFTPLATLALLLAILIFHGCSRAPKHRPNVLVFTLDTTRADRLFSYGYTNGVTPTLDQIASEGVQFDNCQSVMPMTLPAHISIFSGLYPPEHGVRANGYGAMSSNIVTLATVLKRENYTTAAFVASLILHSRYGLAHDFDLYDEDKERTRPPDSFAQAEANDENHARFRDGAIISDAFNQWLDKWVAQRPKEQRFFAWVHLYDVHHPRRMHPELLAPGAVDNTYDASVAYMDYQIAAVMRHLKQNNLLDDTLIVLVGDHGEGLGEHREETHGYLLYQTTQHIPLLWRWSGHLPAGKRIAQNVDQTGILPTILDLLGIRPGSRTAAGTEAVRARSFAGMFQGAVLPERACYEETDYPWVLHWSPMRSIVQGNWRYVRAPRSELFDLSRDPNETNNLASRFPECVRDMDGLLAEIETGFKRAKPVTLSASAEDLARLKSLGYMVGGTPMPTDLQVQPDWPDPKDMVVLNEPISHVRVLLANPALATQTVEVVTALLQKSPQTVLFQAWQALALAQAKRNVEALAACRRVLDQNPADHMILSIIGNTYVLLKHYQEAADCFGKAYTLLPVDRRLAENVSKAWNEHGLQKIRDKATLAAVQAFDYAVKAWPENAQAQYNLAVALCLTGDTSAAWPHVQKALQHDPAHQKAKALLEALQKQKQDPSPARGK